MRDCQVTKAIGLTSKSNTLNKSQISSSCCIHFLRSVILYANMGFEKLSPHIPEENKLPLNIKHNEIIVKSGESNVWKAEVQDREKLERLIALKQVRNEVFANDKEMHKSKDFYEFLRKFPKFEKFVPKTLYFKARMTSMDTPQAFAIQHYLKGKTLDQIPDDELYKEPNVVRQLLEFAHVAIAILRDTRKRKSPKPDFGTAGNADTTAQRYGNRFGNSRYSTNILITDKPEENGQSVFFVDTGINADERVDKTRQMVERQIMGRIREFNFIRWIKKLELILDSQDKA